ncbi:MULTISPECIES: hypothetical protein [unclassified Ruegeria]|uniref:hypothetical protein n=1 Tax=unclassified Ruegeria TaxID=2625375 RepID=UPI001489FE2D|nr:MULTISPECIES: hypothetical protein [unclassified Ruegeria]NOD94122.1 hypothetical protein [Ruegeria sp. HKCCD4884]
MKQILSSLTFVALISLGSAASAADCYADYKAKKDNPLRLHYGVIQVSNCDKGQARAEIAQRLSASGWTLLEVQSVFGPEGLDQRKGNAGQFYLRF